MLKYLHDIHINIKGLIAAFTNNYSLLNIHRDNDDIQQWNYINMKEE